MLLSGVHQVISSLVPYIYGSGSVKLGYGWRVGSDLKVLMFWGQIFFYENRTRLFLLFKAIFAYNLYLIIAIIIIQILFNNIMIT